VAFFSQGIGPLTDDGVLDLSRTILGAAAVIGIREDRVARPLLERLGVPASRVFLTGDDAVEAAYAARPAAPGNGLGIHLRIAPLAASSPGIIERLRPILQESARAHDAPMIPLPISHHRHGGAYDPATIRALLAGYDNDSDGGVTTDTPARLTRSAGRCRIVVTGAYHAAVLALAQGIPAICLGESEYYLQKFRGLVDGFGAGCRIVRLDEPELWTRLREAIDGAWDAADALRRPLLEAAEGQIASARSAYAALRRQLDGPEQPTRGGGPGPRRAQRNAEADASPLTLAQGQRS
jgi:colanic acid/amylovoran biosynthesis protein